MAAMDVAASPSTEKYPPLSTVVLDNPTPTSNPGQSAAHPRPTIVFLHGWQKSLESMRPMGEILSDTGRVILIDLPGFGRSPLPCAASNDGGGWSTLDYAERIKAFLDEFGISNAVIVGHSFGGRIGLRLASRYPELVKGLILIGSHGLQRKRSLRDQVRINAIRTLSKSAKWIDGSFGTRIFQHYFTPRFGSRDYLAAGDLRKTLVKTVNEDQTHDAMQITCPALLLWGQNDQETPLDIARALNTLIHGSTLHVFPHKGHEPYTDVGSHLMASYIERFLHQEISPCLTV